MAIAVSSGSLVQTVEYLEAGVCEAVVLYTLSNGTTQKITHPMLIWDVDDAAAAAGRPARTPADVCAVIAANFPDLAPATITPAPLPTRP